MILVNIKNQKINRNIVAAKSHNEYKDHLLNKNCFRQSMNRIQSKDHRTETFEIDNISLSCFDNQIYIQNNRCHGLALGYQNYL